MNRKVLFPILIGEPCVYIEFMLRPFSFDALASSAKVIRFFLHIQIIIKINKSEIRNSN